MNRVDKLFYTIGWILFILLIFAALLQNAGIFKLTNIRMNCSFRQVTGLYCPGCGGTHAIMELAAGHLLQSFLYHPFVPYTAACFAVFLLWNSAAQVACYVRKRQKDKKRRKITPLPFAHFHTIYIYLGIGLIFIQWIVKNILLCRS